MCYNLATKCTLCSEFVDSKLMKCLDQEVYLDIDGIGIRGCQATNTVDGWPFFDRYRLRSPIITCPNGGTLRLHGVRVLDALCYTCCNDNPGFDNPENKDAYVGDRCGSVYAADYERNAIHYIGSYLHLGSSKSEPTCSIILMLTVVYRSRHGACEGRSDLFRVVHSKTAGELVFGQEEEHRYQSGVHSGGLLPLRDLEI